MRKLGLVGVVILPARSGVKRVNPVTGAARITERATQCSNGTEINSSILCTLPVTSCSAERSFSSLKRIKTPFRSSMTTQRLTGLTLLTVHRDIPVDITTAIDKFCRRHPRRLRMVNILNDWVSSLCASLYFVVSI